MTLLSFLGFTLFAAFLTYVLTRGSDQQSSDGFFLGGRSLRFPVPQFLEQRFGRRTQTLANMIFLMAYALILIPIILYSGAGGRSQMLDLKTLTGITEPVNLLGREVAPDTVTLWGTVFMIGIMGSLYARVAPLADDGTTLLSRDAVTGDSASPEVVRRRDRS